MSAQIIDIAQFRDRQMSVIDHSGEKWLTGEQIGAALEYEEPRKRINDLYRRHADELSEYSVDLKLRSTDGKHYQTRVYNEDGVMVITMLSRQPLAREFRRWAVGVLKAYRRQELPSPVRQPESVSLSKDEYIELLQAKLALLEGRDLEPKRAKNPAPRPLTNDERETIRRLHLQGWSALTIARQIGRSKSSVRNVLIGLGLR